MNDVPLPMQVGNAKRKDDYYTPDYALEYLLPFIGHAEMLLDERKEIIFDPCCGTGNITRYFRQQGYETIGMDIIAGHDFLDRFQTLPDFVMIITNPPYSKKDAFIKRCYEIGKPFALLMPLSALGGLKRCRMFDDHGLQLIIPGKRINFVNSRISEVNSSSWFHTAWFTHGFCLDNDINFVGLE